MTEFDARSGVRKSRGFLVNPYAWPHPRAALQNANPIAASSDAGARLPAPNDHNGGPPLDELDGPAPAWGRNGIGTYFTWRRAFRQARKPASRETMLRRLNYAEACGLTYDEYVRVLLDTGRHVQPTDIDIIARIIARR